MIVESVRTRTKRLHARQSLALLKAFAGAFLCLGVLACTSPEVAESTTGKASVTPAAETVKEKVAVSSSSPLSASIAATSSPIAVGDPVLIDFTVTNTSSSEVKLLPWNTPLEERLSADVFTVMRDGTKALFIGRKMRRPEPTDADYVSLAPGATLENTVDIGLAYNLATPGVYTVQYTPLEIAGVPSFNIDLPVSVEDNSVTIEIN